MQFDIPSHMERIVRKINEGKVALFLGAGVSKAAGAPRTQDLIASIKEKFSKARFASDDFIETCQAVIDCDYYDGRTELEDFIRQNLGHLTPSKWHLELPKYQWAAIFTTNFDDLIEESFRMTPSPSPRDYRKVLTDDFTITTKSILYVFKLMGDIRARTTDPGRMVLSRIDYIQSLKMREKCFEVLSDIIRDGTVVFVGYSGKDQLAFEIMEGVAQKYGIDSLMMSYMFLDDLSCVEGETLKYSRRKIVPIKYSFEEFMEYLSKKTTEQIAVPSKGTVIRISGYDLSFPSREIDPVLEYFDVLNETDLEENAGGKDDFFKGVNRSWGIYREKWDFVRTIYSGQNGLRDRIANELQKKTTGDNRVLLLTGMPGIGKSVLLGRIAFDSYAAGVPVLVFSSTKGKFDFKVLDSFLMHIDRRLIDLSQGKITCAKSIIIFDDVSSSMVDPRDVVSYLASRGRAALVVCASRLHDIENDFLPQKDIINIPQSLSQEEIRRLAQHLEKLGYLPSAEVWRDVILKELESSFFAAMYTLVDHARRPLGKIISEQFLQLTEEQKKAFLLICAFHRFDLPINIELLARVVFRSNYQKLVEVINDKSMRQAVVISEDRDKNTLYSTYNRIIAQKTFDFFLSDPARQKELYRGILDNAHFVLQKERELVEKLLIRNIGPSRNISGLDLDDQLELFSNICRKQPTRSLVHHLGLLQQKAKDFRSAESTLLRALSFHERYVEAYRGESTRNILTSLGSMYVDWAEDTLSSPDAKASEALFQNAEKYLEDAIKFHYPMPHPYHALARMYMRMGDRCKESPQRFDFYAQSLQAIEQGKENVYPAKARMLYEIETMLQTRLENKEAIKEAIHVLAKDHSSARGYYLYSRAMLAKGKSLQGREKYEVLEEALSIINEGLYRFPIDEPCLRLNAEITRELHPYDDKKYFEALERWFQGSRGRSVPFLYELGVTAFKCGYFKSSFKAFSTLEKMSRGYPERFIIKHYMLDEKGQRRIYKGTVMDSEDKYIGEIRVDSLPKLDRNVRFSIELCEFEPKKDNPVTFSIGFDYVGPRALDVMIAK